MLNQLKFAAIDIGSNAVRLLLASVFENNGRPTFKKMSLTRMPIRLGADGVVQILYRGYKAQGGATHTP